MADAERGPIAIICGGGSFPGAVAEAIVRDGRQPVMFGLRGWADPKIIERLYPSLDRHRPGGPLVSPRPRGALQGGSVHRLAVTAATAASAARLADHPIAAARRPSFFRGGDNRLLSGIASMAEEGGLRVIGVRDVAPEVFVPEGVLGRCQPAERDRGDIARAMKMIAALGPFDVGQAAIVANNHVLAVEAAEGTDNMLARIAELRRLGRVTTPLGVGVLVKAPKPGQDRRFDLPSIGPRTIEGAARAGLAGVAVAASSTIIAEAAEVIAMADREKIFLAGVGEDAAR